MEDSLVINNLHVQTIDGKQILNGVSLTIKKGQIHAIMGPNGGGKSTLAQALMGHPSYIITQGTVTLDGKNITSLAPDQKAKLGLFLGFQYPVEVAGVNFSSFLRMAVNENIESRTKNQEKQFASPVILSESEESHSKNKLSVKRDPSTIPQDNSIRTKKLSPIGFRNLLAEKAKPLAFRDDISKRSLNEGFSGGEKKKAEILQLSILQPEFAVLDEPDSGLDVDALRYISETVKHLDYKFGLLLITHYQRILRHIKPDFVHILVRGQIVKSGDANLALEVEKRGYEQYKE